jgi:hypothetical protein
MADVLSGRASEMVARMQQPSRFQMSKSRASCGTNSAMELRLKRGANGAMESKKPDQNL